MTFTRVFREPFAPMMGGYSGIPLRDEFAGTLAAGAVQGTLSDSGHVRTVVDANSKLSIGSGLLSFATGGVGAGDPGLWYPALIRRAGQILVARVNLTDKVEVGWDASASGTILDSISFAASGVLQVRQNGTLLTVGAYASATDYDLAVIERATGYLYFIKGGAFTTWTLLGVNVVGSSNQLPAIAAPTGTTSIGTIAFLRIAANLYIPSPIASDGFSGATTDGLGHQEGVAGGLGSGGSGLTWTGATWAVAAGAVTNAPSVGADVVVNGAFAADTDWTKGSGWSIAAGKAEKVVGAGDSNLTQTSNALTVGIWYSSTFDIDAISGSYVKLDSLLPENRITSSGAKTVTGRSQGLAVTFRANTNTICTIDNLIVKPLVLSELFRSLSAGVADVMADVAMTRTANTQAGIVINLDSAATPANFVLAYHDGISSAKLTKCVAGVYTDVITASATYSAGAVLRVAKIGTGYRLFYNNLLVGSGTISDAGIISNTIHGIMSTYSANSCDNLVIRPSGSNGEYSSALDAFIA